MGSSGSNCRVERSIQSAHEQVRVMRVSLQEGGRVASPCRLLLGAQVRGVLAEQVRGGSRSHAPREAEGEEGEALAEEFGELVQWRSRPVGSGALGKLDSVWDYGVFLEVNGKTVEIAIGARSRIFKARTDRRRSTEDRWKAEAVELTGLPRRMSEDDDKADGEGFAKLQVPEEAIRRHDADVKRDRDSPRVNAKKLLHHKEGQGAACVLGEVPARDARRSSVGPPANV